MMAMSMMDELAPVDGMGPVGKSGWCPTPARSWRCPTRPGGGDAADQVNPDGSPWDGCARTFLKQAIAELARDGI